MIVGMGKLLVADGFHLGGGDGRRRGGGRRGGGSVVAAAGLALAAGLATGLGLLVLLVALRTADAVIDLLGLLLLQLLDGVGGSRIDGDEVGGLRQLLDERAVGLQVGGRARIFRVAEMAHGVVDREGGEQRASHGDEDLHPPAESRLLLDGLLDDGPATMGAAVASLRYLLMAVGTNHLLAYLAG